jgi:hypothetical protein
MFLQHPISLSCESTARGPIIIQRVGLVTDGRLALNWIPQQAIFMLCENYFAWWGQKCATAAAQWRLMR